MILELPHNHLKLQVLFYIPKRFADNLAGRYSFIVKTFCPLSHVLLCQEHGIWNQETALNLVPGKLGDGDLWAGG